MQAAEKNLQSGDGERRGSSGQLTELPGFEKAPRARKVSFAIGLKVLNAREGVPS